MRRASATLSEAAAAVEFVPTNYLQPLEVADLFARNAPLEVDLGCGDSSFLAALAEQHPERNYLGIEQLLGRMRTGCRHVLRARLTNVRLVRVEIAYAVVCLLPPDSVDVFYLMFPDPWPKRRHLRRRVVSPDFITSIATRLKSGGQFRVATDQRDYFEQMVQTARGSQLFEVAPAIESALPRSTFEQRFLNAGDAIYRLELRKASGCR